MADPEYQFFEDILKRESGIVIAPDRSFLLETRLLPVAFKHGLNGLPGMIDRLKDDGDSDLLRDVVEAMAASDCVFFRDMKAFAKLRDELLPPLFMARASHRALRIWSAGCGTGQEAYSIAMTLKESGLVMDDWNVEIVATDLSRDALAYASAGSYTQLEVQRGLPARYLVRYFTHEEQRWTVTGELRDLVHFSQGNLVARTEPGSFDIIFCRYVLQNFDVPTQMKVLQSLRSHLRSDGMLFLGAGESMHNVFKPLDEQNGIFLP